MGRAMGAVGIHVDRPGDIAAAIARARRENLEGRVVVIEVATRQESRFSQYAGLL